MQDNLRTESVANLMTVQEAAEHWGMHASYIRHLCQIGELQTVKFGRAWMIVKDQPNPRKREYPKPRNEPD